GGGTFASILSTGPTAVTINAKTTDVVVLRNLSIQGGSDGTTGIKINSASAVIIENCVIQNFAGIGLDFSPTNGGCQLFLENTTVINCVQGGVIIRPVLVTARASADHVKAQFNQFGF